jgi:hypothetical protein
MKLMLLGVSTMRSCSSSDMGTGSSCASRQWRPVAHDRGLRGLFLARSTCSGRTVVAPRPSLARDIEEGSHGWVYRFMRSSFLADRVFVRPWPKPTSCDG